MIAIVDYGMGNLRSVEKALHKLGHAAVVTSEPVEVERAERVILPGVGAFGAAMANLERGEPGGTPLADAVAGAVASGKPFLGICLGMQLLMSRSYEFGCHEGLGILRGTVRRFDAPRGTHGPWPLRLSDRSGGAAAPGPARPWARAPVRVSAGHLCWHRR